jgi:hypothetical protein
MGTSPESVIRCPQFKLHKKQVFLHLIHYMDVSHGGIRMGEVKERTPTTVIGSSSPTTHVVETELKCGTGVLYLRAITCKDAYGIVDTRFELLDSYGFLLWTGQFGKR